MRQDRRSFATRLFFSLGKEGTLAATLAPTLPTSRLLQFFPLSPVCVTGNHSSMCKRDRGVPVRARRAFHETPFFLRQQLEIGVVGACLAARLATCLFACLSAAKINHDSRSW
ncbi:unnamed protein product [Scytosiphon promiscuus]